MAPLTVCWSTLFFSSFYSGFEGAAANVEFEEGASFTSTFSSVLGSSGFAEEFASVFPSAFTSTAVVVFLGSVC